MGHASTNGNAKASTWASVVLAVLAVLGAISWAAQIAGEVNQNKLQLDSLIDRVGKLEGDQKAIALDTATVKRDLREIETQCRAIENGVNLMHANDMRSFATLWEKVYGGAFHTDNAFYPDICRVNN